MFNHGIKDIMKGFVLLLEGDVKPEWIDESGHMNVMWYTYLFDRANSLLQDKVGLHSDAVAKGSPALAAGRIYTAHRRELLQGEQWQLWSGITHIDVHGITFSHRMVSQSQIRATCDISANAFDLKTRRKTVLPEVVVELGKRLLVPGLTDYFATSRGSSTQTFVR